MKKIEAEEIIHALKRVWNSPQVSWNDTEEKLHKVFKETLWDGKHIYNIGLDIRNELWEEVKELRKEGKYAALKYDKKFSREFLRR